MRAARRHRLTLAVVAGLLVLGGYLVVTGLQVLVGARADDDVRGEAIVVLGAAQYDGIPSPVLTRRLNHALTLWRAEVAPIIVVTGGDRPGDRFTEATAARTWLVGHGVPEEAIRREVEGRNTYDQLAASARFLRAEDITSAVLVSDPVHAARLRLTADEVGLEATVSPTDLGGGLRGRSHGWVRETTAVALGRVLGFRRLRNLRESLDGA